MSEFIQAIAQWGFRWLAFPDNLYDLLVISIYASGTAGVIWVAKRFFREQLSARWHFYIWGILIARLVIRPQQFTWQNTFSAAQLLQPEGLAASLRFAVDSSQLARGAAEAILSAQAISSGAVTAASAGTTAGAGLAGAGATAGAGIASAGTTAGAGASTFVGPLAMENAFQQTAIWIYWAIVALLFLGFVCVYIRLMMRARRWEPASPELQAQVANCIWRVWKCDGDFEGQMGTPSPQRLEELQQQKRAWERKCNRLSWWIRVYTTDGVDSPFVCGLWRKRLVLPRTLIPVDDKVILHELIHVKHHHILLNWLLTVFRCLHFFNPFLWRVFNRIQSDCELLCDERVLKLLGREEKVDHEEYGQLLLSSMAEGSNMIPGTSCLSNGQKNILHRIRRIRGFWKLSGASQLIAWILTFMLGTYCLSGAANSYALEELPSGFGFGVEIFDYNVYYAEQYKIKSPLEAAYGYGLAMTEWNVGYEWLFLSDEQRSQRRERKAENQENGISRNYDGIWEVLPEKIEDPIDKDLLNDIVNMRNNGEMAIYNMHRRSDGSYRAIVRLTLNQLWGSYGHWIYVEDHDIVIGTHQGRYQVLDDQTDYYLWPRDGKDDVVASPPHLPYHAAVYGHDGLTQGLAQNDGEDWPDNVQLTIDYRMDCQTTHDRSSYGGSTRWQQRHIPDSCYEVLSEWESGAGDGSLGRGTLERGTLGRGTLLDSRRLKVAPGSFAQEINHPQTGEGLSLQNVYGQSVEQEVLRGE